MASGTLEGPGADGEALIEVQRLMLRSPEIQARPVA